MANTNRRTLLVSLCLMACGCALACQPGTAIVKLTGIEQACTMASTAIAECGGKLQFTTIASCDIAVQPDLAVANDGTYCEAMRAFLPANREVVIGRFALGRSDLEYSLLPNKAAGVLLMNLKGRVVPPAGGREIPLDCNLMYNVTGGSLLGIAAASQDSLMGSTVSGPVLPGAASGAGAAGAGGQGGLYGARDAAGGNARSARKNGAFSPAAAGPMARYLAAAAGAVGLLLPAALL